MLQAMREGAGFTFIKIVLFVLLGMAMLGLVVMDLGGFFRGSLGRGVIARVGDIEITLPSFDRTYRNQLQQSQLDAATARMVNLPYQVLQQEISRYAILQAAYESGLRVSETYIANNLAKQLDDMGVPEDERSMFFENYLRNSGMNEAMLVQSIQQDTLTTLLMDPVEQSFETPMTIAKQIYAFEKEKRVGHIVSIKMSQVDNIPSFSEDEKKQYYEDNISIYTTPETRDISYVVITKDQAMKGEAVSDEQIRDYYESNLDLYTAPASREFIQVILQDKAKAKEVAAKTMADGNLKNAVADVMGEDGEYDYVPADWYSEESLPPEIAENVYPGKEQKFPFVTGPIETALGFHVIQVTDERPAETKPLDSQLKETIQAHLKEDMALERVYELGEQLDDIVAGGATLADAAKELGLGVKTVSGLTQSGTSLDNKNLLVDVPMAEEVLVYAFDLQSGDVSPLFDTADGNLMAVGVQSVTPAEPKPFEAVEGDIVADLERSYRIEETQKKSEEVLKRLKETDQNLHALATVYNLSYKKTRAVTRQPAQKSNGSELPSQAHQVLFSLTPENPISTYTNSEGITIVELGEIIPVKDIPKNDETLAAIQEGMGQVFSGDIVGQFILYWRDELGVDINRKLLMDQYLKAEEE